jgi:hypothetical protein
MLFSKQDSSHYFKCKEVSLLKDSTQTACMLEFGYLVV